MPAPRTTRDCFMSAFPVVRKSLLDFLRGRWGEGGWRGGFVVEGEGEADVAGGCV